MEAGINFLPELAEKEIKQGVYRRKVNIVAVGALLAMGVVIISLIAYQLFLTTRANDLKKQSEDVETDIRKYSNVEIINLALKEKLDKISRFLNNAIPTSTVVDQVQKASQTSPTITLVSLNVSDSGDVTVTGKAESSDIFGQWVDNLKSANGQEYFDKIELGSFTGSPSTGYNFSIGLSFLKKGIRNQ